MPYVNSICRIEKMLKYVGRCPRSFISSYMYLPLLQSACRGRLYLLYRGKKYSERSKEGVGLIKGRVEGWCQIIRRQTRTWVRLSSLLQGVTQLTTTTTSRVRLSSLYNQGVTQLTTTTILGCGGVLQQYIEMGSLSQKVCTDHAPAGGKEGPILNLGSTPQRRPFNPSTGGPPPSGHHERVLIEYCSVNKYSCLRSNNVK